MQLFQLYPFHILYSLQPFLFVPVTEIQETEYHVTHVIAYLTFSEHSFELFLL